MGDIVKFSDLDFQKTLAPKGIQAVVNFGEYDLSIIRNEMSYGNKDGLYEIGVFYQGKQVNMPGITESHDTVKGFLTEQEVDGIIKKMITITKNSGEQV